MGNMREDWTRLAGRVRARREALGLTQAGVQERGGPSTAKIREIENERTSTLSTSKRRDLERSLHWPIGTVDVILAGGDPVLTASDEPVPQAPSTSHGDSSATISESTNSPSTGWFAAKDLHRDLSVDSRAALLTFENLGRVHRFIDTLLEEQDRYEDALDVIERASPIDFLAIDPARLLDAMQNAEWMFSKVFYDAAVQEQSRDVIEVGAWAAAVNAYVHDLYDAFRDEDEAPSQVQMEEAGELVLRIDQVTGPLARSFKAGSPQLSRRVRDVRNLIAHRADLMPHLSAEQLAELSKKRTVTGTRGMTIEEFERLTGRTSSPVAGVDEFDLAARTRRAGIQPEDDGGHGVGEESQDLGDEDPA